MTAPSSAPFDFAGFYRNLSVRELRPDDPLYVPLFERPELSATDPVASLRRCIEWTDSESLQLFSGFRGTGKSTALIRLERDLVERGALVVRCDMEDHLNMSEPVDVIDFLVSLAGAWSDALDSPDLLGRNPAERSWWERLVDFARKRRFAEVEELEADVGIGGLRVALKSDPVFKERLQEHMKGHLSALVEEVRAYVAATVRALRARHGANARIVLLLDSVEHLRGTYRNARQVEASLENLFGAHADKLRFPSMHVVVTVPPWLRIRVPGLDGHFDNSELLPCIRVRDQDGVPYPPGRDALAEVVGKRGDWRALLGDRAPLDRLVDVSGGYIRDLFRLLREALHVADQRGRLPLRPEDVELVVERVRNHYLPLAEEDARWLARVRASKEAALPHLDSLATLSRFFDTHLVLAYRNGREWYDVHPIVADVLPPRAGGAEEPGDPA